MKTPEFWNNVALVVIVLAMLGAFALAISLGADHAPGHYCTYRETASALIIECPLAKK